MTDMEKIRLVADALEVNSDSITEETLLESMEEWDSLGVVSMIAMFNAKLRKRFPVESVLELKRVGDILALMED